MVEFLKHWVVQKLKFGIMKHELVVYSFPGPEAHSGHCNTSKMELFANIYTYIIHLDVDTGDWQKHE